MRLLPVRKDFVLASAMGHDESGAGIAAIGDRHGLADGGFRAGRTPPTPCSRCSFRAEAGPRRRPSGCRRR